MSETKANRDTSEKKGRNKLRLAVAAALVVLAMAGSAFADAPLNEIQIAGCEFKNDRLAGKDPYGGKFTDGSSLAAVGRMTARQTQNEIAAKQCAQEYGDVQSVTAGAFARTTATWTQISNMWFFEVLPTLSQEDANILSYVAAGFRPKLWLGVKGGTEGSTTQIAAIMMAYDSYKGQKMEPGTAKFFRAFFSADAAAIKTLIKEHKDDYETGYEYLKGICKAQGY